MESQGGPRDRSASTTWGARAKVGRVAAAVTATVTMVVALVAGLSIAATPASAQDHPPGVLPDGDWTPDQATTLLDLVDRAEQELPAFASEDGTIDEDLLEQLGFVDFGTTAPGGWDHWVNVGWFDDDYIIDPRYPESLVFRRTDDGDRVLEAAMFFLGSDDTMDTIPEEIEWMPGWHAHPELCVDEVFRHTGIASGDGTCATGAPVTVPMMHVWIADNPCGHRFAGVGVGGINCGDHNHEPGDPFEICQQIWGDEDGFDVCYQIICGDDDYVTPDGIPAEQIRDEAIAMLDIDPDEFCDRDPPDGNGGHGNGHGDPPGDDGNGQDDGPGDDGVDSGDDSPGVGVRGPQVAPPAPAVRGVPNFTG